MAAESCAAKHPCLNDPDEPCFCGPTPTPGHRVRLGAEYVEQVRTISGNHRWPLSVISEASE